MGCVVGLLGLGLLGQASRTVTTGPVALLSVACACPVQRAAGWGARVELVPEVRLVDLVGDAAHVQRGDVRILLQPSLAASRRAERPTDPIGTRATCTAHTPEYCRRAYE